MYYSILLYTQGENTYLIPALWAIGVALFLFMFISIFVQRRAGVRLKNELEELEKVKQNNVEYEFVLKAMRLCTWHIDVPTQMLTIDADYRDDKGDLVSLAQMPLSAVTDAVEKSDRERVRLAVDNICTGRSNTYHEVYRVMSGKAGMTYWEESYGTIASRDEEGNPKKIVCTSMRIDAQKEMESALIAARNKAEESDRLKTAFLANMGHEIRTPLNAIVGFADLLPVIESDEERAQIITEIQNNNKKLLQIIDGLVSMSKIEAGAKSLLMGKVELNQLLQQMAETYQPTTNLSINVQCPLPQLKIETDREKLLEILDNLLQNAIKFTTEGEITLSYEVQGNQVRVNVTDTGKGVAEEDQTRIFERFVKVDEYVPGTGLGLSVVESHIKNLGGMVGVESSLGKGSTFWFVLPLE